MMKLAGMESTKANLFYYAYMCMYQGKKVN